MEAILIELRKRYAEKLLTWALKLMPVSEEKEILKVCLKLYYGRVVPLILRGIDK